MYFQPNTTNTMMTEIFITTIMSFTMELSSTPRMRNRLITTTIAAAGRLIMPPSQGQAHSSCGSVMPTPSSSTTA